MISEFFFDLIFKLVSGIFEQFPTVTWTLDTAGFNTFRGALRSVAYMLPMDTVWSIFKIICALTVFRFVVALVKTIWDLLPFA